MSTIAGLVRHSGRIDHESACRSMLAELAAYGPSSQDCRWLGDACFGRALRLILPEDDFDRQPLSGGSGRYLLASDVRIDNRPELAAKLGVPAPELKRLSDSALLLLAWERWQVGAFKYLLGDIAAAVWDSDSHRLTLARSPVALKPLFYHVGRDFVAFASMPQALLALPQITKQLDHREAAAVVAGFASIGSSTMFEGVLSVRPGEAIEFTASKETVIPFWDPEAIGPSNLPVAEHGEALRAELDRAVSGQLRRRSGVVACQLSSGRDSSAVATAAALALRRSHEPLLALTGAPMAGFAGPSLPERLADESGLAAVTAERYPEIVHVVCRSRKRPIGPELRRISTVHYRPVTNPSALQWALEIDQQAVERGASVMLNGSTGNHSISASGPGYLIDVLREQGLRSWGRSVRRIGGSSWSNWRKIGTVTLGPWLPKGVYRQLLRFGGRTVGVGIDLPLLRPPYRTSAEELLERQLSDPRPPSSFDDFRRLLLRRRDNAEKMSLALSGLDIRDPTGDRRLVELCLSFGPDQLVSQRWAPSPIYEYAFRDRIPSEVMYNRTRGYQGADWFELFSKKDVGDTFRRYGENSLVRELFDFACIEQMVATWPEQGSQDWARLAPYRNQLLQALALADFIDLHFPG